MYTQKIYKLLTLCLVISLGWLSFGVSPARAEAPANDDFDFATPILSLPFSDEIDITVASLASDDPVYELNCAPLIYDKTVWYSFTAGADTSISISTAGSEYWAEIQIFTGSRGSLTPVGNNCTNVFEALRLQVSAGTTYYMMAPAGYYEWDPLPSGGILRLSVTELLPPVNDDFANATLVNSLPFVDSVNTELASLEVNETAPCGFLERSIWYAFTPQNTGSYTASVYHPGRAVLAVYTGDALENLTALGCSEWGLDDITFLLQAGTTYYFQASTDALWGDWVIGFNLVLTPPPTARFFIYPYDPSSLDTIYFYNDSVDPGELPLSAVWDFGDGITSTEWSLTHQYLADGDYLVQLTVTAPDGRYATTSQMIQVRTHDVAITRFTVPQSASAGQTRQITVYMNNKYYDETVQVHLYKSTRYGYEEVGTLTMWVPARSTNKTVAFAFSYTFTAEDAVMGKVTFRASADPLGVRDVLPADNEVIALPTKVNR